MWGSDLWLFGRTSAVVLSLLFVGHLPKGLGFLTAQAVKNLPVMQETWVWSLGQEDPLKWGMATHSSILAWKSHVHSSLAAIDHGIGKKTQLSNTLISFMGPISRGLGHNCTAFPARLLISSWLPLYNCGYRRCLLLVFTSLLLITAL